MKRVILTLFLIFLFSGCSLFGNRTYIAVESHDEGYEVAIDSNAITVNSYLGLKNAIMGFVREGVENGVIQAESYPGEITEDLDDAVYEVWRGDPLGAYAVDYMTYDCSKIINRYEIHIHTTFRRSLNEIESIVFASDPEDIYQQIALAMDQYQPALTLRIGDYNENDVQNIAELVYREHPELALEMPTISTGTYPDSGSQRIVEIKFTYKLSTEELMDQRRQMLDAAELLISLYGNNADPYECAEHYYQRLSRQALLEPDNYESLALTSTAYNALVLQQGNSYDYAYAFKLLLNKSEIDCAIIDVGFMGQSHGLCLVTIEEESFYVDPSRPLMEPDTDLFSMTQEDMAIYGYELTGTA